MSASPLQFDLPPARRVDAAGYIPWVVAIACVAALVILLTDLLHSIPQSLQSQAQKIVQSYAIPGVQVATYGRDLHLTGDIDRGQSLDSLLSTLEKINGVRTVKDNISVVDPDAVAEQNAEQFLKKLQAVDALSVAFKPGSVSFTPDSEPALQALYKIMSENPDQRIRIEGHTDNTGPNAVNLRLSQDRASAVANYLSGRGIELNRLIVKGYGSTQPIDTNDTETGRSKNRRIEISHVY